MPTPYPTWAAVATIAAHFGEAANDLANWSSSGLL